MRILELNLKNFRCFKECSLPLARMRPVNRIFKTVQRRAIMFGATSCHILQSSAPAIADSWSGARTTAAAGRTQWPRVHLGARRARGSKALSPLRQR
jgi:hypothetical protein